MVNDPNSSLPAADGRLRSRRGRREKSRCPQEPQHLEQGKWIWIREQEASRNTFVLARKVFTLPSQPTEAVIHVTADTRYKLYLNGDYVGRGPVPGGSGVTYFDSFDVTQRLRRGDNVIALLVHFSGEHHTRRPGLLCQLDIQIEDRKLTIATDETWDVRRADEWTAQGAQIGEGLGFQEVYDARLHVGDWNRVKCRETGWDNAVVVGPSSSMPWGRLVPREIPLLAEERILPRNVVGTFNSPSRPPETAAPELPEVMAASILSPLTSGSIKDVNALLSDGGLTHVRTPRGGTGVAVILDFGREVFGHIEVGVARSGSGVVDIGYGEKLEEGRVKPNRGGLKYADRLILKNGRMHWRSFEPRALRYMQLEFRGCTRPVAIEYVRVNQTTYPVKRTGSFECSDGLLNEIWRAGAYTTQLCMQDTFITSPWSERTQWWGDARIESRVAYYVFNDTALLAQGLRQIVNTQASDGSMPGMYPAIEGDIISDYALLWVFSILDYYAFADDVELLRQLYPNVQRLLAWFGRYAAEDRLLSNVPGRLFIDHADIQREGDVTALNCLYYQGLRVASVIARVVGRPQDADQYEEDASKLRLAINKHLYSARRGLYAEGRIEGKLIEKYTPQTNVLAALFDIPDHYQKSTICRQLLNGALPGITTPYFASFLLDVLYSADLHAEALDIIRQRWGPMIEAGNATLWENFTPDGDLCHGWAACPTRDLLAEYVGIKPALSSHRFSVAPHTGGLKWARGSVATKAGPLSVHWRAGRDHLVINVEVPQGLTVDVYSPGPLDSRMSVDGKHQPERFVTLGEGTHQVKVSQPRPKRAPKYDEGLAPIPTEHVQVLGEVYSRRSRRRPIVDRRRKGSRTLDNVGSVEFQPAPTPEVDAEELLEIVREEAEAEIESDVAADLQATAGADAEAAQRPKRGKSRRGARRRSKTAHLEDDSAAPGSPDRLGEPKPQEVAAVEVGSPAAEPEPETVTKRRRSRRGGRKRTHTAHGTPEEQAAHPEAAETSMEDQASVDSDAKQQDPSTGEENAEVRTASRRRGRSGTRRPKPSEGSPAA